MRFKNTKDSHVMRDLETIIQIQTYVTSKKSTYGNTPHLQDILYTMIF